MCHNCQIEKKNLPEFSQPVIVECLLGNTNLELFHQNNNNYYSVYRIVSSCMQLLVHDMEMACTTAFNAMVKVRGGRGRCVGLAYCS